MSIDTVLDERQKRYGDYDQHAETCQALKLNMFSHPNYDYLPDTHKEALEMIQHKIARVLNGDPNYIDNWVDISGYATLVLREIEGGCVEVKPVPAGPYDGFPRGPDE